MKVKDLAMKEVYCAEPTANLAQVASMMKRHGIGAMPVCNGDRLIGMLTDRDIVIGCVAAGLNPANCPANEFMTSNPVTVRPDMELEDACQIMAKEQIRRLPVVEGGRLVGLLSLGDVATALTENDCLVADTLRRISTPTHAAVVH